MTKIFIGSDHGAFLMKEFLKKELEKKEIKYEDCGCFDESSVDYPDIAKVTCQKILKNPKNKGILLCGTGIGISISANKIKGIRAALCHNEYTAQMAREHNDANVLCLGGRVIGFETAKLILNKFLLSKFLGERHLRRLDKIKQLEC